CWPALGVLGVFLVLGLFDLLPTLPGLLHAAALLSLAAAFVVSVAATFRRIVVPDRFAASRRIEQASGLHHRPLQTLADRPSGPLDSQAAGVWEGAPPPPGGGPPPPPDRAPPPRPPAPPPAGARA